MSRIRAKPAKAGEWINHLTLTTGDLVPGRPSGLPAPIRRAAAAVVLTGSGMVLDQPAIYGEIVYPRNLRGVLLRGAAFFQFSTAPDMSAPAVVMGMVCWADDASAAAWDGLRICYHINKASYVECEMWRDPPADAPPAPWVATWLTPSFLPLGLLGAELVRAELAIGGALVTRGLHEDQAHA